MPAGSSIPPNSGGTFIKGAAIVIGVLFAATLYFVTKKPAQPAPQPTPIVSTTQNPQPSGTHTFFCSTCPENNPWYPSAPPDWWQPGMPTETPKG